MRVTGKEEKVPKLYGVCKKTTGPTGRRSHLWAPPAAGWSARDVPLSRPPALRNVLEWFHSWLVKCG